MKPEAENLTPSSTDDNAEMETVPSGGKKRVAYSGATQTSSKPKLCRQQTELLKTNTGVNKLLTDLTGQPPTAPSTATSTKEDVPQKTSAQSFGKGKPRVAHKVKEELLQRPIVDASAGDRIPFPRRQHVLDKFTDACLKKFATTEEAFEKAIELELACFVKSLSIPVYNNLFVSNMLKLKHSSEKKEGVELYKRLTRYILSEELLKRYSYPMLPENEAERGKAVVYNVDKNRLAAHNGLQRDCTRCQALFYVDKNGMPKELSKDELCIFHPKRAFPKRVRGCIECYFACCDLPIGAEGCETCKYHICDKLDLSKLHGFVQTFEKDVTAQASGVYALDCEMCLTTEGTELTRITVIDDNSSVVYSGVDEAMLKNVTCSLRDVQSVLLNLFSKDTILIGHSLNSDLMVLKLIHYNVVDTSIVYPHREESGHDSKEDAVACMDLMKLKVKEAAKLE
ncbi:hypothetical protein B566_EDAN006778 [Ephemera danica]|nr:hypothetical protein B566_EDAN006778 [Ephemera danica]